MLNKRNGNLPGLKEKRYQQKKSIISDMYRYGTLSKPQICRLTNMTTPTIGKIVNELLAEGWLIDLGQGESIGGKRPHIFSLNPNAAYIIGIDLGREQLRIAIFDLQKHIIGKIQEFPSILESQDNSTILQDISDRISSTLETLKIPQQKVKVAGVSIPGLIDNDGCSFTYLNFEDCSIKEKLEEMLHIPVFIDNDCSVMAMAEHTFGTIRGISQALCINVNECIGMGMLLNGRPYTGYKGMAGEFGHIQINSQNNEPCYCGQNGCLETTASGRALIKTAQKAINKGIMTSIASNAEEVNIEGIINAAVHNDTLAIGLLKNVGEQLGKAIANLIHIFNPEVISLGGKIIENNNFVLSSLNESINKYTLAHLKNQCTIVKSTLGNNASILGTLSLVMEHIYYDQNNSFSLY